MKKERGEIKEKEKGNKDSKEKTNKKLLNKKAQVTLFIIVAIVIIAAILLVYFLVPGVKPKKITELRPYIDKCAEDSVSEALELTSKQGGVIVPENYIMFQDNKIEYLCYSSEYYKLCAVQKPFPEKTLEDEISRYSEARVKKCLAEMELELEKKGYEVEQKLEELSIDIVPNSVIVKVKAPVTITKDTTTKYENFRVGVGSEIFDLTNLATTILRMEATYGDSEILQYMLLYPDIKVEKLKQGDGSTIYILTHRKTQEKFVFASRSLAWPPGYGITV